MMDSQTREVCNGVNGAQRGDLGEHSLTRPWFALATYRSTLRHKHGAALGPDAMQTQ